MDRRLARRLAAWIFVTAWAAGPRVCPAAASDADTIELDKQTRARCLAVLRAGMKSDEHWPAMHAAEALTLAGHGDEVLLELTPRLKVEKDDQHRCGLARELVRAGDRTKVAVLLDVLAKDDPYGHVHACESLYKVNEIGDGRLLRQALQQRDAPKKMLMAAAALARWGNSAALAELRQTINDKNPDLARIAAWVLARIGSSRDVPLLKRRLARLDDPLARTFFGLALAALGDEEGQASLARDLMDQNPATRTYAATFAADARMTSAKGRLIELLDDECLDVRVRAAQSLCLLAQSAPGDPDEDIARDVYQATAEHPRYSEGSVLALCSGTLLYATTEFIGGAADAAAAQIVVRSSEDDGRTWGDSRVIQENVGRQNVMSVTLRHLACPVREVTPIGMFYLVKSSPRDLQVWLRLSHDDARTFGTPIRVSNGAGYHVMNNDRVTLLSSGRLLAPIAGTADAHRENHFVSYCFLSDDGGRSWRRSKGQVDYTKRGAMEPEVIELSSGRVAMILRTQLGHIAVSYSDDHGDTWTGAKSWGVRAPEAPATLRRISSTGDLLLIYNDTFVPGAGHGGKRTPLTAAVSTDEGRSWKCRRHLETAADQTFAYTSLAFVKGRAVMSYYVRDEKTGRISSRFRSVPIAWLYGDCRD